MRLEPVERRVLAAIRFLDATTRLPVRSPLRVSGAGLRFVLNRRGYYVLTAAPGLEGHSVAFPAPPPHPVVGALRAEVAVSDPGGRYLPRALTLALPRDPAPGHADQEGSLFRPVDALLYPAPVAAVAPGWAVIRATVLRAGTGAPLPGALLRVVRKSDGEVLARALSEWRDPVRGEALVAVPGVPITTWGDGRPGEPVLVNDVPVSLEAYFDPSFDPASGNAPDPERLELLRPELPAAQVEMKLASGRTEKTTLTLAVP